MQVSVKLSDLKVGSKFKIVYNSTVGYFTYEKVVPIVDPVIKKPLLNALNLINNKYTVINEDHVVVKVDDSCYCKSCATYSQDCDKCKSFENWRFK